MSLEWHYTLFIRSWNDLFICTSMYFSFKPIFSSLRDVVTQVWLMMTHRSSEHQSSGAGFTWQDTQHHRSQSLGPGHRHSHLKLECHVKTTSRRPWGARNPKRRLQCSFRVSLHFSPAQAAVGRSSEPHSGLAHSDNGYNSNLETRRRSGAQWYSDEMIHSEVIRVTCVVRGWGHTRLVIIRDVLGFFVVLWAERWARRALCPQPRGHQVLSVIGRVSR